MREEEEGEYGGRTMELGCGLKLISECQNPSIITAT